MSYNEILKKIEEHINLFYLDHPDPRLTYHNYSHTREVVNAVQQISEYYQLDEHSRFIVNAAAYFHDAGYALGNFESHEERSAELAEDFLKSNEASEEDISEIKKCILATRITHQPLSLPEKIICDADFFHLGTDKFKENNKLIKREIETFKNIKIDGNEWRAENIKLLENHRYYTDYCKTLLDKTKEQHLNKLKNKQLEKLVEDELAKKHPTENIKSADRQKEPTRGIQTMFRISSSNSQQISMMADNKANIMISINSIIISVVLGLSLRSLDENTHLIIPTIILLAINVATIIYSVLATRPKVTKGTFTPEQVENKSVNLLFYGSFYNMNFQEYASAMRKMMTDREFLYGSLTKDIYWQGKVLGRKYRLLRISYNIFMYGMAASVIAYTLASFFHGQ